MTITEKYMLSSIGHVSTTVTEKSYQNWGEIESKIVLDAEYQEGLLGLEGYSHLLVIFYMHNFRETTSDKVWARQPRGRSDMPHVGVFAQRTKYRPNPLGITAVKLVSIEDNVLTVKGLDANDGTPVLDIKPYVPEFDRVMDTKMPDWMSELMHHYF